MFRFYNLLIILYLLLNLLYISILYIYVRYQKVLLMIRIEYYKGMADGSNNTNNNQQVTVVSLFTRRQVFTCLYPVVSL